MEKAKKILLAKKIAKYALFLVSMIVLNSASLNSNLQPFGFAMFFALIWCNQNIILISIIYLLSNLVLEITEVNLICCACTILMFLFFYFLHYKLRKPLNIWLILVYAFLSQIAYMYFNIDSVDGLFYCVAYLAVGLIFLLATLISFQAVLQKKFKNFTIEEYVCTFLFFAIFSLGLSYFEIFNISILQIVAIFVMLFLRKISKTSMLLCAISMGLGASLNSFYTGYLIIFCSYAMIIWIFSDKNPIFMILGLLFIDLFIGLYLQVLPIYYYQSLLAVLLPCIVFLLIPKKYINYFSSFIASGPKTNLVENVVNVASKKMNRRLLEVSEIFDELQSLFKSMGKAMKSLKNLVFLGLKKGKLTLMDVEDNFSKNCIKLNSMIPYLNELIAEYKKYENNISKADTSRNIVARSLGGVSAVLQDLAFTVTGDIKLDSQNEKDLQEELAYEGILCREILIYEKEYDTSIALLINNNNLYKNKITKIVSKVMNMQMNIVSVSSSETANFSNVLLKVKPKFDIVYGLANKTKAGSESSGDTYTFNRLDNDIFLFALCDGMGSGNSAKKASELSIGIIENLYKAGFKSETVIDCANNFLTMASSDVFTALDVGVLDLKNGILDTIKIGGALGFIKHQDNTEIIDAGALPLGILEELRPSISKTVVSHGDNIILMTDGVLDAFENEEVLRNFINNIEIKNPQTMADKILNEAIHLNNQSPNDDMTVFIVRVLEKKD